MSVQRIGLALMALVASAGSVVAQAPVVRWSRTLTNEANTFGHLGNEGSEVWIAPSNGVGSHLQLSANPPLASDGSNLILQQTNVPAGPYGTIHGVARRAPVAASLTIPAYGSAPRVEHRRTGALAPESTVELPGAASNLTRSGLICLDDGGASIVWNRDTDNQRVRVYRVERNGTIAWSNAISGWVGQSAVLASQDGSKVLYRDTAVVALLDGASGALLASAWDTTGLGAGHPRGLSASDDLGCWAYLKSDGRIAIERFDGTAILRTYIPAFAGFNVVCLAMDPSGLSLAICLASTNPEGTSRLAAYQRPTSNSEFWSSAFDTSVASPAGDLAHPIQVAFLEGGKALAMGLHLVNVNSTRPDVHVYRKSSNGNWSTAGTLILPGSFNAIDGWQAGPQFICMTGNSYTAQTTISICATRPMDLQGAGMPEVGATLRVQAMATSGTQVRLLRAPRTSVNPVFLGNAGVLRLERSSTVIAQTSVANSSGVAIFDLPIANLPSLVGTSFAVQGMISSPRRLSQDWMKVNVLP